MPDNPAHTKSKIIKLAALDWEKAPAGVIQKELGVTHSHLTVLRANPYYAECFKIIEDDWREKFLKMPGTAQLRRKISYGMGIATDKLLSILNDPKTAKKDLISAARLISLWDGRFAGAGIDDGGGKATADTDEVAKELTDLMERHKRVQ